MSRSLFLLLTMGLFLQACSPFSTSWKLGWFSPLSSQAMHARLLDVSYPLLTAAADWCPFDQEPTYGFFLRENAGGEGTAHDSAQGRAMVVYVHPSLPAAVAGLSVDDVITTVNTVDVMGDPADKVGQLINRVTRAKIQPLQLEVVRGGQTHTIVMSARLACHYTMRVLDTDIINGITDGRQIGVTSGALQFFPSHDELGWVVAHEIAHNILSHSQNMKLQAMLRAFLAARGQESGPTNTIRSRPLLESQADYVGAYLMARAGYDLSAIQRVWERLERIEVQHGGQKSRLAQTHPATKDRLAAFDVTLREIEAKRRLGQALEMNPAESAQ